MDRSQGFSEVCRWARRTEAAPPQRAASMCREHLRACTLLARSPTRQTVPPPRWMGRVQSEALPF
eukprot:15441820-Alexandrium_andersonii.AAC.1